MEEQEAIELLKRRKVLSWQGGFGDYDEAEQMAIKALEEIQQYRALGTVEELKGKNEKLQAYKNQISIYAEQHKVILASDVLDMLEELE